MGDPFCQVKPSEKMLIQDRSRYLAHRISKGEIDDLDALASLADYAVSLTPDCAECVIDNLGAVLVGHSNGDDIDNYAWEELMVQSGNHTRDLWFLNSIPFSQNGYDNIFQDPTGPGNQAYHFWFYVMVGYQSGSTIGNIGVDAHEDFLSRGAAGRSEQDRYLGYEGVNLGVSIKAGTVDINNLGNYIRERLSPGSATALYYQEKYCIYLQQLNNPYFHPPHP
ncbi:MAG: hypothetical protein IPG44_06920 [Anaerolineales bacterium]|nr:hypothetical protein [Anaerolineales bacterium]